MDVKLQGSTVHAALSASVSHSAGPCDLHQCVLNEEMTEPLKWEMSHQVLPSLDCDRNLAHPATWSSQMWPDAGRHWREGANLISSES